MNNSIIARSAVRCAIVGCGRFGRQLLKLIHDRVQDLCIVAAVTHPLDVIERVEIALGDTPVYRSLEQLLTEHGSDLDAVILTSANYEHRDQAIAAANAGKHIFCEKPMALTTDDCTAMVRASQQNKVKLMVGHKRRLRLSWQKLLEIVQSGALGTIVAANINGWHHHDDIASWWLNPSTGGGLLHRAGCHDIDFLHALLGKCQWVQAIASENARGDAAQFSETMWLTIGYANGAVAGLQVSLWFGPTYFRDSFDVQVLGNQGSALLKRHVEQPQELFLHVRGKDAQRFTFQDDGTDALLTELRSFARWIMSDEQPVLTWREGLACVQVIEAAYESARAEGRRIEIKKIPL